MVTRLKVIYKHPEIDVGLDKRIEKFFESIGFHRWASGYDLLTFERDLAFEKRGKEKVGKHGSKRNKEAQLTA